MLKKKKKAEMHLIVHVGRGGEAGWNNLQVKQN